MNMGKIGPCKRNKANMGKQNMSCSSSETFIDDNNRREILFIPNQIKKQAIKVYDSISLKYAE